jgi:hypothetical protein
VLTLGQDLDKASGVYEKPGPWTERQRHAARRTYLAMSDGRAAIRSALGVLAAVVAAFGLFGRAGRVLWESIILVMVIDLARLAARGVRRAATRRSR